tara:strand:- start:9003 stop:9509 length:507 start_codon:yes stop_codon:yes gene_type:complete
MGEVGCLKDGCFQNLQVEGTSTIAGELIFKKNVTNINAATSLNALKCGEIVLGAAVGTEQAAGAGFQVKLPTPAAGLWFNFTLRPPSIADDPTAAITILATSNGDTPANIAVGSVTVNGAPANVVAGADTVTFVHNAATCGDYANCFCDGTNWFFTIVGDAAGSVTLA